MSVITIVNLFVGLVCLRGYLKCESREDPFFITYGMLLLSGANLGFALHTLTN